MFRMGGAAVVAATFFLAVSGSAMLAVAADQAGTQTQDKTRAAQERAKAAQGRTLAECQADGGWYHQDTGVCELETVRTKAAAMEKDEKSCQLNGGTFDKAAGVCAVEARDRAKK